MAKCTMEKSEGRIPIEDGLQSTKRTRTYLIVGMEHMNDDLWHTHGKCRTLDNEEQTRPEHTVNPIWCTRAVRLWTDLIPLIANASTCCSVLTSVKVHLYTLKLTEIWLAAFPKLLELRDWVRQHCSPKSEKAKMVLPANTHGICWFHKHRKSRSSQRSLSGSCHQATTIQCTWEYCDINPRL